MKLPKGIIAAIDLFQSVQIKMQGHARSRAPCAPLAPTAPATAWSACGVAAQSAVWTPTPTSSPSRTGSVWSGRRPPAPVSIGGKKFDL